MQTLNWAQKRFNSIFIQNLNLKYSFNQIFIKQIHGYSFNTIFIKKDLLLFIQQNNAVSHRANGCGSSEICEKFICLGFHQVSCKPLGKVTHTDGQTKEFKDVQTEK